jgi:hypothetical protein
MYEAGVFLGLAHSMLRAGIIAPAMNGFAGGQWHRRGQAQMPE